ncbi:helix-turn-helix domain-containing protein [Rudaea sp.]|uniref:TetR/AcrR family transcriptional regulator n=1 Tax=Rudaea sp. TaxID=2136325 RepID=UPI00321FEDBF
MSLRDLTMEKVAKRAGVGKPTLYRWWKTKAALVIAMFNERIVPEIDAPPAASLEESIRHKVLAR